MKSEKMGIEEGLGPIERAAIVSLADGIAARFEACLEEVEEQAIVVDRLLPPGSAARQEIAEIRMATAQGERFVWQLRDAAKRAEGATDGRELEAVHEALCALSGVAKPRMEATGVGVAEAGVDDPSLQETIGEYAGGLAHRFNNLLTVLKGNAELLLSDLEPDHPGRGALDRIGAAVDAASALTLRLLSFGGRRALSPQAVRPGACLRECRAEVEAEIGDLAQLEWSLPTEEPAVRFDPAALRALISELAANAARAGGAGGRVRVRVRHLPNAVPARLPAGQVISAGDYSVIEVEDGGCGMERHALDAVFLPFGGEGETGLGLASVYGIVRQSGGAVAVESRRDAGTTVRVYLPVSQEPVTESGRRSGVPRLPEPGRTVLVADDSDGVRGWLRKLLERWGYVVLEARDGGEAVQVAEEHPGPLDLVIADVVMPVLSGPAAYRRIADRRPETRVLFMSGYGENTLANHRLARGGGAVLAKPVTPVDLVRLLDEVWSEEESEHRLTGT